MKLIIEPYLEDIGSLIHDEFMYIKNKRTRQTQMTIRKGTVLVHNDGLPSVLHYGTTIPNTKSILYQDNVHVGDIPSNDGLYISTFEKEELLPLIEDVIQHLHTYTLDPELIDMLVITKIYPPHLSNCSSVADILNIYYTDLQPPVYMRIVDILTNLANSVLSHMVPNLIYKTMSVNITLDIIPYMNGYELYYKEIGLKR